VEEEIASLKGTPNRLRIPEISLQHFRGQVGDVATSAAGAHEHADVYAPALQGADRVEPDHPGSAQDEGAHAVPGGGFRRRLREEIRLPASVGRRLQLHTPAIASPQVSQHPSFRLFLMIRNPRLSITSRPQE